MSDTKADSTTQNSPDESGAKIADGAGMRLGDIDDRNEVKGLQLLVLHSTLCFANFLAGLIQHNHHFKGQLLIATRIPM